MEPTGTTVVVTGATSGLGQAVAIDLAAAGARVLIVGRDEARARETAERCGGKGEVVLGDVSTRAGAKALADAVLAKSPTIDVLINNAGGAFLAGESTVDGIERTFALNVVGGFVLERALHGALAGGKGRVVNLVTTFLNWFPLDPDLQDLVAPKKFGQTTQYARSKLAGLMVTVEQAKRSPELRYVALHPGVILGTRFAAGPPPFVQRLVGPILRGVGFAIPIDEAVRRFRIAAFADDVPSGSYLVDGKVAALPRTAEDADLRQRVYALVDGLATGAPITAAATAATA